MIDHSRATNKQNEFLILEHLRKLDNSNISKVNTKNTLVHRGLVPPSDQIIPKWYTKVPKKGAGQTDFHWTFRNSIAQSSLPVVFTTKRKLFHDQKGVYLHQPSQIVRKQLHLWKIVKQATENFNVIIFFYVTTCM